MKRVATSVAITDPLVGYQSLVATGVYSPDLAQHRLAHHLQKLYERLKDYSPAPEYRARLQGITKPPAHVASNLSGDGSDQLAVESHSIWRNPLFARVLRKARSNHGASSLALTRVLTDHQAALHADSPKGLFLSGEVGTGKSMLLDLLARGLPTSKKRRWHFNTFMLYAFSRLEQFRMSQGKPDQPSEYSLLWMAGELVETSPILFLDEFQLPDRAAAKLLSNLFVAFFQLGGVLIASSNRVPEELEKASGGSFRPPPTGGLVGQMLGIGRRHLSGELYGQSSDFAAFLEVLKARCDFWHMEGATDWRRRDGQNGLGSAEASSVSAGPATDFNSDGLPVSALAAGSLMESAGQASSEKPAKYYLLSDSQDAWNYLISNSPIGTNLARGPWRTEELFIFGRTITVPRQRDGASLWSFSELFRSFGPADYLSLASTYHTFIIDQVPVLTVAMKNEARRFITFLDALYESGCKLFITRAEAGPDDLFFPDARGKHDSRSVDAGPPTPGSSAGVTISTPSREANGDDAVYPETIAEVFQDQTAPFRPNISTYSSNRPTSRYNPDQDSDFGIEQTQVDFVNAGAFTGEDERFAYRRATSRLWELCSERWHARTEDWWRPLPPEARYWEKRARSGMSARPAAAPHRVVSDVTIGPSVELDGPVGRERVRIEQLRAASKE